MQVVVLVSIYYTKKKDERNLLNDLAGIAIFALAGMGSYYFSDRTFLLFNLQQNRPIPFCFIQTILRF